MPNVKQAGNNNEHIKISYELHKNSKEKGFDDGENGCIIIE